MASAMNNNLLSLASNEVVSQCVDSLRYSRSALARMLVDSSQQLSLPQLLHVLTSDDLLNKTVIPGIMSLDLTDEERCTKLFKCLEESMLSIPDAEPRRYYIVQLLKTFIDNDLRGIALVIHKPLSIAVIQDVEGTYSPQSSDYGKDEDYRRYSMEENSAYVSPLQSSMSYPGATSTEPSAPTPGLELGPDLSVSDESALHGPQRPLAIKVCYSDNFFGPLDGEESDDEIYRNCSSPRGLVFIANYTFSDSEFSHLQPREGSQRDVDNLREVFEQMGYCVPQVHSDLDKRNTLTALRKFRDDRRHNDLHSSVIVIMSHGKDDGSFYTNDGRTIKTSDVLDLFNSANCPALAAKFKLFIFQFCRGALHDWGAAKNVSLNIGRLQTDSAAQGRTRSTDVLPIHSDQFCIYPCVEGYVSLRHPNRGTWLMEALCDVFMNHAHEKDLNKLLQMVSKKIRANESDNGMKQTCESRARGIVKSFYFNPVNLRDSQNRFLNLSELSTALTPSLEETSRGETPHASLSSLSSPELVPSPRLEAAKRANWDASPTWPKRRRDTPRSPNNNNNNNNNEGSSPQHLVFPVTFASELFPSDMNKRRSADLQFLQPSSLGIDESSPCLGDEFINNITSDLASSDIMGMPTDMVDSPSRGEATAHLSGAVPRRRRQDVPPEQASLGSASIPCDLSSSLLQSHEGAHKRCSSSPNEAWGFSDADDIGDTKTPAVLGTLELEYPEEAVKPEAAASFSVVSNIPDSSQLHRRAQSFGAYSPGGNELTYREYRRQKSMEMHSGKTLDDPPTSIKRQLSIESERELLGFMNKVKSFVTVHKGEDSPEVRSVHHLMHFLESKRAMAKKARRGGSYSQD